MQLVYNGPHPEVVVDELDQDQVITAGQPTEIPDDLAARLLEQDTWSQAGGETPEQRAARLKQEQDQAAADAAAKAAIDAQAKVEADQAAAANMANTKGNS